MKWFKSYDMINGWNSLKSTVLIIWKLCKWYAIQINNRIYVIEILKKFATTLNLIKIVNMIPKEAVGSYFMVVGWSKNVSHHGWPTKKNFKITMDKTKQSSRNLNQKLNDSKPHIWSLSISDFLVKSLKGTKN